MRREFWFFATQNIPLYKKLPWRWFYLFPFESQIIIDYLTSPCEHVDSILGSNGALVEMYEILQSWAPLARVELYIYLERFYMNATLTVLEKVPEEGAGPI